MKESFSIFNNVPSSERKQKWFLLLEPLIQARCLRPDADESKLIKTIAQINGLNDIKSIIELAIKNCKNAESILSGAQKIRTSKYPDQVIDEIFAELRAVKYLINRGATDITYHKENHIDFVCVIHGATLGFEVTYVNGPDFKTQEFLTALHGTFQLDSQKLVNRLKTCYQNKKKQLLKHGYNHSNGAIIIVSDLLEMYEPWMAHDLIDGKHPLEYFVVNAKIHTIILSSTIYEPDSYQA